MASRLLSYDRKTRTAVLAGGARSRGRLTVKNVSREQAEALAVKLERRWDSDAKRGEGLDLTRTMR